MSVYEKLMNIQSQLKAPKGQFNKFGNYNYRSCEDIVEALKPLLKENKLALIITDTVELIGERYYIKATVKLMDIESPGSIGIEVSALAREEDSKKGMDASQLTGSTSSYARKYALNGMFCIDDTKDSDSMDGKEEKDTPKFKPQGNTGQNKPPVGQQSLAKDVNEALKNSTPGTKFYPMSESQKNAINKLCGIKNITEDLELALIKEKFNKEKLDDLSGAEASSFIQYLQSA